MKESHGFQKYTVSSLLEAFALNDGNGFFDGRVSDHLPPPSRPDNFEAGYRVVPAQPEHYGQVTLGAVA